MSRQSAKLTTISKSYGPKTVLESVSLVLNRGEHIALVGANGSGKSTLAKILIGSEIPDSGTAVRPSPANIGYLPQEVPQYDGVIETVEHYLLQAQGQLVQMATELKRMEDAMHDRALSPKEIETLLNDYGELQEEYSLRGGYDGDHRLIQVLEGLGLDETLLTRALATLSGGQRRRVAIAALLLKSPELLVLDEPTNHLDADALAWFESYLTSYYGAVLLITHDRRLLESSCTAMVELSPTKHTLERYTGNYSAYLQEKQRRHNAAEQAFQRYEEEHATLKGLIKKKACNLRGPGRIKDNNKMAYKRHGELAAQSHGSAVRQLRQRLETLEASPVERPTRVDVATYHFEAIELVSDTVLALENVAFSYDNTPLLTDINVEIHKGERLAIVGPNGCGKSTLLKLIAGHLHSTKGNMRCAPGVSIGALEQDWSAFSRSDNAFELMRRAMPGSEESLLHKKLFACGALRSEDVQRPISELSSGMRQKLQLALLAAGRHNILLLDEPTNHLDLETLENLERALLEYAGTVVFVTHDQRMLDTLATRVWSLNECP